MASKQRMLRFLTTFSSTKLTKPMNTCHLLHSSAKRNTLVPINSPGSIFHEDDENTDHVERLELLSKVKGLDDPFQMTAKTVKPGTKEDPTVITTIYDQRIVGCVCQDDSVVIKWTRLHLGESKKCECGHWFKLLQLEETS